MLGEIDRYGQPIQIRESDEVETCSSTCIFMLPRVHIDEYIKGDRQNRVCDGGGRVC